MIGKDLENKGDLTMKMKREKITEDKIIEVMIAETIEISIIVESLIIGRIVIEILEETKEYLIMAKKNLITKDMEIEGKMIEIIGETMKDLMIDRKVVEIIEDFKIVDDGLNNI